MKKIMFFSLGLFILGCSTGTTEKVQDKNAAVKDSTVTVSPNVTPEVKADGQRFLYEPAVSTISGIIYQMEINRLAKEGESDNDAHKEKIPVIILKKPIYVVQPAGVDTTDWETYSPNAYNVDTIQLVLTEASYDTIIKATRHQIQLKGTFFHGNNGHHFTDVLMEVTEINLENDSTTWWKLKN